MCQVTDYIYRGDAMTGDNVLEFFVNSYEVNKKDSERERSDRENLPDAAVDGQSAATSHRRGPGRPRHERVNYQEPHPRFQEKQRVRRRENHHNLPNFIGRYFPTRDDPEQYPFYCACMLMLLKPWRNLELDLKMPKETWQSAFQSFVTQAPAEVQRILSGIQYFHHCERSAQEHRETNTTGKHPESRDDCEEDVEHSSQARTTAMGGHSHRQVTEEDLLDLISSQTSVAEELHARHALEAAKFAGIFNAEQHNVIEPPFRALEIDDVAMQSQTHVRCAQSSDMENLMLWKEQMTKDIGDQNSICEGDVIVTRGIPGHGDVLPIDEDLVQTQDVDTRATEISEPALTPVNPSMLNEHQRRALDIVSWHLDYTLSGGRPPPLRMLLVGEGGTGKSKVIQTITEYFRSRGALSLLLKAAYTGVAASLIDGKTTHTIGMVTRGDNKGMSARVKAKLQQFWQGYEYLIINEMSMLGKTFLAKLSRNIAISKMREGSAAPAQSFGGINVILCGDFHQFPPVAVGASEALYMPVKPIRDNSQAHVGRAIYEEFQTVVILKQQIRVTDKTWQDFLGHLRVGRVQKCHIDMLRQLVLTTASNPSPDFTCAPWADACLVTPRHAVCRQWNDAALRKHAHTSGGMVFVCTADDTVKGEPLSLEQRYAFAQRASRGEHQGRRAKRELPDTVELSVGMKVMVTQNVETDLDITNGARGTIVDIILHPQEPAFSTTNPVHHLKYMPSYILVKLGRTRASKLTGLEPSVIPVEPLAKSYSIRYTLFNLYVSLSRSSGRDTIRLLRDFDEKLFLSGHSPDLLEEDDRLARLEGETQEWWSNTVRGKQHMVQGTACEQEPPGAVTG